MVAPFIEWVAKDDCPPCYNWGWVISLFPFGKILCAKWRIKNAWQIAELVV
jgi:hypothetical protein